MKMASEAHVAALRRLSTVGGAFVRRLRAAPLLRIPASQAALLQQLYRYVGFGWLNIELADLQGRARGRAVLGRSGRPGGG